MNEVVDAEVDVSIVGVVGAGFDSGSEVTCLGRKTIFLELNRHTSYRAERNRTASSLGGVGYDSKTTAIISREISVLTGSPGVRERVHILGTPVASRLGKI